MNKAKWKISFTRTGQWLHGNKMQARFYSRIIFDLECLRHHLLQKSNTHKSFISAQAFQRISLLGSGTLGVCCQPPFPNAVPTSPPTHQLREHLSTSCAAVSCCLPATSPPLPLRPVKIWLEQCATAEAAIRAHHWCVISMGLATLIVG